MPGPRTRSTSRGRAPGRPRRSPPVLSELLRRRWRLLCALGALIGVLGTLGWLWAGSLVPSTYSVMEMGHVDHGGGPAPGNGHGHGHGHAAQGDVRSVAELTGPTTGEPDVAVELTARQEAFELAGGERLDGYTLNGTSPGPALEARQGDLVQVTLINADVPDGVTLHWHGLDVPNAEDGVAGVTQDAVLPGQRHVYRFVAADAGTYWYHSHQVSHEQVRGGLFGTLVILPPGDRAEEDVVVPVHNYGGRRTIGGSSDGTAVPVEAGRSVRLRLVNTDNGRLHAWVSGSPFQVVAVDGTEVHGATEVRDRGVAVAAGGRVDLLVTAPARLDVRGGPAVVVGPPGTDVEAAPEPSRDVDLLGYGSPAALGFDPADPDRRFDYRIGRRLGVLDGRPGFWWTVNGAVFPDVPMFHVEEGDVVRMTIVNDSGDVHPMHLHGHHAVVLSRNGVAATGSPWWVDSLDVEDGQTYEIAFVADNPGVWMDHCHNLDHARDGLVAHLAYAGVTAPFRVGGRAGNEPE